MAEHKPLHDSFFGGQESCVVRNEKLIHAGGNVSLSVLNSILLGDKIFTTPKKYESASLFHLIKEKRKGRTN